MPQPNTYLERVRVPAWWWVVAAVMVISVLVAAGFALGLVWGLALTAISAALVAAVLVPYGHARIEVDDRGLRAGDAFIEWPWVGAVAHLDQTATQQRLRGRADARAYLFQRPYLTEAVEVTLADPADPHPYWLITSRHAEQLAAAIAAHLAPKEETGV